MWILDISFSSIFAAARIFRINCLCFLVGLSSWFCNRLLYITFVTYDLNLFRYIFYNRYFFNTVAFSIYSILVVDNHLMLVENSSFLQFLVFFSDFFQKLAFPLDDCRCFIRFYWRFMFIEQRKNHTCIFQRNNLNNLAAPMLLLLFLICHERKAPSMFTVSA